MFSMRNLKLCAVLCFSALTACTTIVSGEKATPKSEGKRYSLPFPILEVIPNPDGTITVQNKFLPDPNNEYTVSAVSLMSKYTFDIQTKAGLLQSITMDADSTGVAKEALNAGAEVGKAKIEADAKAAEAESKAAAERASKIAEKKLALAQAKNKLAKMKEINIQTDPDPYSAKDIAQATLDVVEAETAYKAAQAQVNLDTGANLDTGDNNATPPTLKVAWGPVYYRIVQSVDDDGPTVSLIAADWEGPSSDTTSIGQKQFWTSTTGKAPTPPTPDLNFQVIGSTIIRPENGRLQFKVEANGVFDRVLQEGAAVTSLTGDATPVPVTVTGQPDGKTVVVDLPDNLDSAMYALHFRYRVGDADKRAEVSFSVQL